MFYGDTTTSQGFTVHKLNEPLVNTNLYYSNQRLSYTQNLIGFNVNPLYPTTPVYIGGNISSPQLRIRLDNSIVQDFIGTGTFNFNGFHIRCLGTAGVGAIANLDLKSDLSNVTVFYNGNQSKKIFLDGKKYSYYDHTYTSRLQNLIGKAEDQGTGFIQSMAGVKTLIRIPNLNELVKDKRIAVNKAELVLNAEDYGNEKLRAATRLLLVKRNENGRNEVIPDVFEAEQYYGGKFDKNSGQYVFNLARHIQQVLNSYKAGQDVNYGLYLIIPADDPVNGASRVILNTNKESKSIKLNLTYTVIN